MANQSSEQPRYRSKWPRPPRDDGRKQFLVFLPPKLVQSIKGVALDRGEHAYQLVERIMTNAIDRLKHGSHDQLALEKDWPVLSDVAEPTGFADLDANKDDD